MSILTDDTAGITVHPVGSHEGLWLWAATLGDGQKKGYAGSEKDGLEAAKRAKRYLLAVESHDPDAMEAQAQHDSVDSGKVTLISSWGGQIEVNPSDVTEALANGCRLLEEDDEPQHAASVSPPERARRKRTNAND